MPSASLDGQGRLKSRWMDGWMDVVGVKDRMEC